MKIHKQKLLLVVAIISFVCIIFGIKTIYKTGPNHVLDEKDSHTQFNQYQENSKTDLSGEPKRCTSLSFDDINWKTYTNANGAFSFEYPDYWTINAHSGGVSFYNSFHRCESFLYEGMSVTIKTDTLESFITAYQESDPPFSEIYISDEITFSEKKAYELVGSTALGLDRKILFVPLKDKAIAISRYNDPDVMNRIFDTFQILK